MDSYWAWWSFAVILVIMEMFSGTFYLLAVALGLLMAGGAAYLGFAWSVQVTVATLWCIASIGLIHFLRKGKEPPNPQANFSYDVGQSVNVVRWQDPRHARVFYRGTEWEAELAPQATADAQKGVWRIQKIDGSRLIIE